MNLAEASLRNVVDLQAVAKIADWIYACHGASLSLRFGSVLEDAEHDELSGPDRCDADLADQPAVENIVLRHRGPVAGDVESLLLGSAHQCPETPLCAQEEPDSVNHTGPQAIVIRFKNDPLRSFVNRAL